MVQVCSSSASPTSRLHFRCILLFMLLVCSSLVHAHTSSALLNKARRAGSAAVSTGSKLKAGVRKSARLSKKAAASAVAAGLKGGQMVVEASSTARRTSQRTWEAARAARDAAQAAYNSKQDAKEVTVTVFPARDPAAVAESNTAANSQEQLQGRCDLADLSACAAGDAGPAEAAAEAADVPAAETVSASKAAVSKAAASKAAAAAAAKTEAGGGEARQPAATKKAAGSPPPVDADSQHASQSAKSPGWWLVVSHCLAALLGWVLRGRHATYQQQQHRQRDQQQPARLEPPQPATSQASSPGPQQQQEQQQQRNPKPAGAVSGEGRVGSRRRSSSGSSSSPQAAAPEQRSGTFRQQMQRGRAQVAAAAPAGEQQGITGGTQHGGDLGSATLAASTAAPTVAAAVAQPAAAAADTAAAEVEDVDDLDDYVVCDSEDDASSSCTGTADHDAFAAMHAGAGPSTSAAAAAAFAAACDSRPRAGRLRRRTLHGHSAALGAIVRRRPHAVVRRHAGHQGELMPLQKQGQAVQVVGQQTMIINNNNLVINDEAAQVLVKYAVPVVKCVQEVGESLKHISDVGRRWMGWTDSQNKDQQLAAQQELLDRAGHFGQLLGLVIMGLVALRAGRLWDVHQVCQSSVQQPGGWRGWAHQMAGTHSLVSGLSYLNCCSQQLGLYAAGMFLLYLLLRLSWSGSQQGPARGCPSKAYQMDLLVVKGVVCSWLGAHVVHCLGGAWLPWLVGWLLWCAAQLWMNVRIVNSVQSSALVLLVAVVLPLVMSVGSFRPGAISLQGWALTTFPLLQGVPWLGQLLPW